MFRRRCKSFVRKVERQANGTLFRDTNYEKNVVDCERIVSVNNFRKNKEKNKLFNFCIFKKIK